MDKDSAFELTLQDRKRWPSCGRFLTYGFPVIGLTASCLKAWSFNGSDPILTQVLRVGPSMSLVDTTESRQLVALPSSLQLSCAVDEQWQAIGNVYSPAMSIIPLGRVLNLLRVKLEHAPIPLRVEQINILRDACLVRDALPPPLCAPAAPAEVWSHLLRNDKVEDPAPKRHCQSSPQEGRVALSPTQPCAPPTQVYFGQAHPWGDCPPAAILRYLCARGKNMSVHHAYPRVHC